MNPTQKRIFPGQTEIVPKDTIYNDLDNITLRVVTLIVRIYFTITAHKCGTNLRKPQVEKFIAFNIIKSELHFKFKLHCRRNPLLC